MSMHLSYCFILNRIDGSYLNEGDIFQFTV